MSQEKPSFFREIQLSRERESKELLETNPREVWIVDDNKELIRTLLRIWEETLKEFNFRFEHYELARQALEEIFSRVKEKRDLPGTIFVDGLLEKDEGEDSWGGNFIKKIRDLKGIIQPKMVAFSNNLEFNEEMKKAGADEAIEKIEIKKSLEFLRKLVQEKEGKEE